MTTMCIQWLLYATVDLTVAQNFLYTLFQSSIDLHIQYEAKTFIYFLFNKQLR